MPDLAIQNLTMTDQLLEAFGRQLRVSSVAATAIAWAVEAAAALAEFALSVMLVNFALCDACLFSMCTTFTINFIDFLMFFIMYYYTYTSILFEQNQIHIENQVHMIT